MLVGTVYNSEDTCKTMSLHVTRFNASLRTHPSTYNVYKSQFPNSFSPAAFYILQNMCALFPPVPPLASPQPAHCSKGHLRALRDTGNTCHGSPDVGEGSSRAHTCTACPWNAERERQDYGCTCKCGDSSGCPMSSGDKLICTYIY